jgi:hypothetical protein
MIKLLLLLLPFVSLAEQIPERDYAICKCIIFAGNFPGYALIGYRSASPRDYEQLALFETTEWAGPQPTEKGMADAQKDCEDYRVDLIEDGKCSP